MIINFQLLIEKNKHKIKDLSLIGFTKKQLSLPYQKLMAIFLFIGLLCSIPLVYFTITFIKEKLGDFMVIENSSLMQIIGGSVLFVGLIIILNSIILNRTIQKIIKA